MTDESDRTLTPDQANALSDTLAVAPGASGSGESRPSRALLADRIPDLELGELLGRGGMGEVLLGEDRRIGRAVAVKRMRGAEPSPEAVARFLREAKIQARLDHPAIVPVHELGVDAAGRPFFTMKRLTGTTLADVLQAGDRPIGELLRALVDVCHAVELAHARGVIHRDLKPANVMLGEYGAVYVLDWGLARLIGEHETGTRAEIDTLDGDSQTQAGAVLGTPGYMSPEQVRGDEVGTPADIYALGAILYEVLAGEPVHPRGTAALASTSSGGKQSPALRRPDREIAPELDALCTAALAQDPASRPTASDVARDLQRYLDGDRDLERRRTIAAEQLAIARRAATGGDRAEAMRAAGRALALDPASEAAALIGQLLIEPPAQLPAALESQLDREVTQAAARQAAMAVRVMFTYFLMLPFLVWIGVDDWAVIGVTFVLVTAAIVFARLGVGERPFIAVWGLVVNAAFVVMLSRFFGPFIFVPGVVASTAVSFAMFPTLLNRPVMVIGIFVLAYLIPIGLELTGVWSSTWSVADHQISIRSPTLALESAATSVMLVVGNLVLTIAMPIFVHFLARAQHTARRQLAIQAWHLEQLLPR